MPEAARLGLISNVHCVHDHLFKTRWDVALLRVSEAPGLTTPPLRRDLFRMLDGWGVPTVPNGRVLDMAREFPGSDLVVYLDERAHRGEGKERMEASVAADSCPDAWCSLMVGEPGVSTRHFQWGDRALTMDFESRDPGEWRSQKGPHAVTRTREGSAFDLFPKIPFPLFAIDFVGGTGLATDLQFSPGHMNDGLWDAIGPREAYSALARAAHVLVEGSLDSFDISWGRGLVRRGAWEADRGVFEMLSSSGWDEADAYGRHYYG